MPAARDTKEEVQIARLEMRVEGLETGQAELTQTVKDQGSTLHEVKIGVTKLLERTTGCLTRHKPAREVGEDTVTRAVAAGISQAMDAQKPAAPEGLTINGRHVTLGGGGALGLLALALERGWLTIDLPW